MRMVGGNHKMCVGDFSVIFSDKRRGLWWGTRLVLNTFSGTNSTAGIYIQLLVVGSKETCIVQRYKRYKLFCIFMALSHEGRGGA